MISTKNLNTLFLLICLILSGVVTRSSGQQKLIHYWHFNNFTGQSTAGSPALITPVHANWSSLDSTKALIEYDTLGKVSSAYQTYWDANTGDTTNARMGTLPGVCLRVRNPSDSMQLLFKIPTTHYKNIGLKFALQKSSTTSGQGKQVFDYSIDGGKHWKTSGLSIPGDSLTDGSFALVSIDFKKDSFVNDNPDFVFRIIFKTQTTGTKGNNRFDNVTVEGDTSVKSNKGASSLDLIHYWNFNNFKGLGGPGSPSLIVPFHANWSALDSTKAIIEYDTLGKVSSAYQTYWDAVAGDTTNARQGADAGMALRVRNPSDSMQLLFRLPTSGYKKIAIKFAMQKSSLASGQGKMVFDYSIDGAKHWKTSGLSIPEDSLPDANYDLVSVDFNKDTLVNNNPNFVFRILFITQNSGTKGNNRFDNFTVEGTKTGIKDTTNHHTSSIAIPVSSTLNVYVFPNPVKNQLKIITGSRANKNISISNLEGKLIYSTMNIDNDINIDVSRFPNGLYIIHITEPETGKTSSHNFIKN